LILWKINIFDRIVLRGWRVVRQNLCMNVETGDLTWRDVPWR
jgi:hypothetical protein